MNTGFIQTFMANQFQVPQDDLDKAVELLNGVTDQAKDLTTHVNDLMDKVKSQEINTAKVIFYMIIIILLMK